jgi:hypothetical protein
MVLHACCAHDRAAGDNATPELRSGSAQLEKGEANFFSEALKGVVPQNWLPGKVDVLGAPVTADPVVVTVNSFA